MNPTDIVSCPHCQHEDKTCCQCNGIRRCTFDRAVCSVEWIWEFGGCRCSACNRLRTTRLHIERLVPPHLVPSLKAVPVNANPVLANHDAHADTFGKSFEWCQHEDCVRVRRADRRIAS